MSLQGSISGPEAALHNLQYLAGDCLLSAQIGPRPGKQKVLSPCPQTGPVRLQLPNARQRFTLGCFSGPEIVDFGVRGVRGAVAHGGRGEVLGVTAAPPREAKQQVVLFCFIILI